MDAKYYATEVVKKLVRAGYTAYFAGGWVRDLVMGHPSDDIDIATNAPPDKILDLFSHTILVGLAFGVVVVVVEGHQFEVSTFRRDIDYQDGRKPSQIELATPEEDATRRDFTINGMFYDPIEDVIHDFVHGRADIKAGIVRTIGNPDERFVEDRLRMIRAVRFAARFHFTIDPDTQEGIRASADTLFPSVAIERVCQEFKKMSAYPNFDLALVEMHRLGLLPVIFPSLEKTHLNDIRHRVSTLAGFPKGTPTIAYLAELFPGSSEQDIAELGKYLRMSNEEIKFGSFLAKGKKLTAEECQDPYEWAHFYANPLSEICVKILSARLQAPSQEAFLQKHKDQKNSLKEYIQRIAANTPLVNAALLKEKGVHPGKNMGILLKEAEKLSIRQKIKDPERIVSELQNTNYWPRSISMYPVISSMQNQLVKHLVKLRQNHDYRIEHRTVVIEGKKMVQEICQTVQAKVIIALDESLVPKQIHASEVYLAPENVIEKISGLRQPEGIVAEVPLPHPVSLEGKRRILALDGVSDPGNMGTLIRTAFALGWEAAFLLPNCCDPFNEKALRASMGAAFRLPIKSGTWKELDNLSVGKKIYAADLQGRNPSDIEAPKDLLLILGSESQGLSEEAKRRCEKLSIPMRGDMDSLNVAVAGGIMMYALQGDNP